MLEGLDLINGDPDLAHLILFITTFAGTAISTLLGFYQRIGKHVVALISSAELKFQDEDNAGQLKLNYVVNALHKSIPFPFRCFFPKTLIKKLVEKTFQQVKRFSNTNGIEALPQSTPVESAAPAALPRDETSCGEAPPQSQAKFAPCAQRQPQKPRRYIGCILVREKNGKVTRTQYSVQRWEYPSQAASHHQQTGEQNKKGNDENATETDFAH